jgi:hypothetical protein
VLKVNVLLWEPLIGCGASPDAHDKDTSIHPKPKADKTDPPPNRDAILDRILTATMKLKQLYERRRSPAIILLLTTR